MADSLRLRGESEAARTRATEALHQLRDLGDRRGEADARLELSMIERDEPARSHAEAARAIYADLGITSGEADALLTLAHVARLRDDMPAALSLINQSRDAAERGKYVQGEAQALLARAEVMRVRGFRDEAKADLQEVYTLAQRLENGRMKGQVLVSLAHRQIVLGEYDEGERLVEKARTIFRGLGAVREEANALLAHGMALAPQSAFHGKAVDLVSNARLLFQQCGDRLGEANCLAELSDLSLKVGAAFDARNLAAAALTIARQVPSRRAEAASLTQLGHAERLSTSTRADDARRYYDSAIEIARQLESRLATANVLKGRGALEAQEENLDLARKILGEAVDLLRREEEPLGLAEALSNLGQVHARLLDGPQAREAFAEALALFSGLGESDAARKVQLMLDNLDAFIASGGVAS